MGSVSGQNERSIAPAAQPGEKVAERPTAAPGPADSEVLSGLIGAVLEATEARGAAARPLYREFLAERSPERALALWARLTAPAARALDRRKLAQALGRCVARLDAMLTDQVNAVLHHPRFQQLEASWRGLRYLVEQAEGAETVKIRVLSVSWKELARDAERAIEFDQSQLFRKIYSEEFDTPGGEPFGVLLGDYDIYPRPGPGHPTDDVAALAAISHVAAAAFAPFIAAAHPTTFGLTRFTSLEQPLNLSRTFDQLEYLKWRSFRDTEDSRFVGLTLPRVLVRLPYEDDGSRADGFRFREDVVGPDHGKYLWGSAAWAFGAVLIRSFAQSGWLADVRGVEPGVQAGGLVAGLPAHSFTTDKRGVAVKCSTDVIVSDRQEPELSDLGFIPLCQCKDTEFSAFYTNQSAQKPKKYDDPAATVNAKLSSMLQYTLCVSRFAHYIKALGRDKVGTFTDAQGCQDMLHGWLQNYVTPDAEASPEVKAKLPLREARVEVRVHPHHPGSFLCTAYLWPHFELEELTASLKVTTELTRARRA
jgi:type VI secretion system protein ImpD